MIDGESCRNFFRLQQIAGIKVQYVLSVHESLPTLPSRLESFGLVRTLFVAFFFFFFFG